MVLSKENKIIQDIQRFEVEFYPKSAFAYIFFGWAVDNILQDMEQYADEMRRQPGCFIPENVQLMIAELK